MSIENWTIQQSKWNWLPRFISTKAGLEKTTFNLPELAFRAGETVGPPGGVKRSGHGYTAFAPTKSKAPEPKLTGQHFNQQNNP